MPPYIFNFKEEQNAYIFSTVMLASFSVASKTRRRIAIAHKNEEKINARDMVKNLIIGIIIIFVVAMGAPLLINGLSAWVTA